MRDARNDGAYDRLAERDGRRYRASVARTTYRNAANIAQLSNIVRAEKRNVNSVRERIGRIVGQIFLFGGDTSGNR